MRTLGMGLIQSKIDYGSSIYANVAKTTLAILQPIKNKTIRLINGLTKTTPNHVLDAIIA
jgi:hypothetical protein